MTPADHANTLREALEEANAAPDGEWFAALDALLAQAETAEAALVDGQAAYEAMGLRAEAAEAERDHAQDALRDIAHDARMSRDMMVRRARAALSAREEAR